MRSTIVRGVVSLSFSGVEGRQVGHVVEGQETGDSAASAPGPAPDCPVAGLQGPDGGCRALLLTVLTVRWWGYRALVRVQQGHGGGAGPCS